jgi:CBS domain-containing protein
MAIRSVGQALGKSVFIEGRSTVQEASAAMLDARTEAAVVLAADGPAGLLTAEHIARALAEGRDATRTAVIAIADREPLLARVDEPLVDAHQRMRGEQRDLALAVDSNGLPVGLVEL